MLITIAKELVCSRCKKHEPKPSRKMCHKCTLVARTEASRNISNFRQRRWDKYVTPILLKGCTKCGRKEGVRLCKLVAGFPSPTQLVKYNEEKLLELLQDYEPRCEKDYVRV